MSNIQIFQSAQFGQIRTAVTEGGEPLFCLSDVCGRLELTTTKVAQRLQEDVLSKHPLSTRGGTQTALFVNEDGLYDVILDSRKPEAKQFRKWVTSEVLPALRKTGGYMVAKADETPEQLMARALMVAQETLKRSEARVKEAEAHNKELEPKALFADAVATSDKSVLVAELAKILKQNGVDIGKNRLFEWLRKNEYLCSRGEYYNQPSQRAMDMGLFELKKTSITKPDGTVFVTCTTKVTGKGLIYFVNRFLGMKGSGHQLTEV